MSYCLRNGTIKRCNERPLTHTTKRLSVPFSISASVPKYIIQPLRGHLKHFRWWKKLKWAKAVTFHVLFNVLTCHHKSVTLLNQNIGNYTVCKTNRFFILHYVQKVCIAFWKQKTSVTVTEQRRWLFVLYWDLGSNNNSWAYSGSSGYTGISTDRTATAASLLICPSESSLLAWTSS